VTEADPIRSFSSMADSAGQYSLREVTEEDWERAAAKGEELRKATVVEEAGEEAASLTVASDHAMEEDQRSSAADTPGTQRQQRQQRQEERAARVKRKNEEKKQWGVLERKLGKATLENLRKMMDEARRERAEIYEEVVEMIDARAYNWGQGEGDLRARLVRIEEYLAHKERTREENKRLQKERLQMQAEIFRLRGAEEGRHWDEVYCFVRNHMEWERDEEKTEEEEEEQRRSEVHRMAEQAAEKWRMERELPEGWGGFEEQEDAGMQMGRVAKQMVEAVQKLSTVSEELEGYQKQGRDNLVAAQAAAKEASKAKKAVEEMKVEMEDPEAEVEKLTRAVE